MAKKKFDINKRSKPMTQVIAEFESSKETIDAVNIFEKEPNKKNQQHVVAAIQKDPKLEMVKSDLLIQIQEYFVKAFSSNIIPTNYKDLKNEAKYLADLNQVSGLYMAQRLCIIRDKELYREDGYKDFISFIESELSLSKSTVYNYIDIIENFSESKRLDSNLEKLGNNRSKLVPFIPLLKSDKLSDTQKNKIRKDLIKELESKSYRELCQVAKDLKVKYELTKPKGIKKIESPSLVNSLEDIFSKIKNIEDSVANNTFIIVLEHLEKTNQISKDELNDLITKFNHLN